MPRGFLRRAGIAEDCGFQLSIPKPEVTDTTDAFASQLSENNDDSKRIETGTARKSARSFVRFLEFGIGFSLGHRQKSMKPLA